MKIVLQQTDWYSREALTIIDACLRNDCSIRSCIYGYDVFEDEISVGSVEFVEAALGRSFKPEYHPVWLKEFVKRKTWTSEFWPEEDCYVKPNDLYKIFANTYSFNAPFNKDFSKEYFCQEAVEVRNEWRIYVSNGKAWNCSWYQGPDEDKEFDQNILKNIVDKIPKGWYGTIDMMETNNGIELCECHHPYAIGWYGDSADNSQYFNFIVDGYKYLKTQ